MDEKLAQDQIEQLLQQAHVGEPRNQQVSQDEVDDLMKHVSPIPERGPEQTATESIAQGDIELLLQQAQSALASIDSPAENDTLGVIPFRLEDFSGAPASTEQATIELVNDVELNLQIELGRTRMYLEDVLKLRKGSVVSLNKLAGDPVDIYINGRLVARGEVLVLNDNFCVRVAELIAGDAVG